MAMEVVQELEKLLLRKKDLEAELKLLKLKIDEAEEAATNFLTQEGMQSVKTANGNVIYLAINVFAKAKEGARELLVDALEAAGFKDLITVNHNTLRGFCKEQIEVYREIHPETKTKPLSEMYEALPKEIAEFIELGEKSSIRMRKS